MEKTRSRDRGPPSTPGTWAPDVDNVVGQRLRQLRKQRRLTLDVLASQTGFTKGYLSKIERGRKVPPIASLARISQALAIELADLLQPGSESESPEQPRISVVRSHERQRVVRGGSTFGYDYQALAHAITHKHMHPFIFTFPPHLLKEVHFEHEGEEMIFILSGTVEFEAGDTRVQLSPGDCVYFDASLPHRGRGINGEAKALVVIYTPEGQLTPAVS